MGYRNARTWKSHVLMRKTNEKKAYWKCSLYNKKYKCGVLIHVENEWIIMMDFEKAAMNGVKSEFPNTSINRCFFTYHNVFGATYKKQGYKILNLPYIFVCYLLLLMCYKYVQIIITVQRNWLSSWCCIQFSIANVKLYVPSY